MAHKNAFTRLRVPCCDYCARPVSRRTRSVRLGAVRPSLHRPYDSIRQKPVSPRVLGIDFKGHFLAITARRRRRVTCQTKHSSCCTRQGEYRTYLVYDPRVRTARAALVQRCHSSVLSITNNTSGRATNHRGPEPRTRGGATSAQSR